MREQEDVTKRVNVSLDDDLYDELEKLAEYEERTVPNLLAYLGREAVRRWRQEQSSTKVSKDRSS